LVRVRRGLIIHAGINGRRNEVGKVGCSAGRTRFVAFGDGADGNKLDFDREKTNDTYQKTYHRGGMKDVVEKPL
jgi:hypothetical protein